ncbi:hypothetical protein ACLOJK_041325 [Asimina triloba]
MLKKKPTPEKSDVEKNSLALISLPEKLNTQKCKNESSFLIFKSKDHLIQKKKSDTCEKVDEKILTTSVPTSQVLGRVKDFLGIMADANKRLQLEAKNSERDYDIEVLTGNEKEYIEMDLVLGVADLQTPEAVAAAESAMAGSQLIHPSNICSDSSDSDDGDADDNEESTCLKGKDREQNAGGKDTINSNQGRKRPKITEL